MRHRLPQHASNQRAAAPPAAGARADAGAFADLLESPGARLNRFDYGAFADLIAETSGFEVFDDRLFSGFLLCFVDGGKSFLGGDFSPSVT
jgi:hypothetical protein